MSKEIDKLLEGHSHIKIGEDLWIIEGVRVTRVNRKWHVGGEQVGSFIKAVRRVLADTRTNEEV